MKVYYARTSTNNQSGENYELEKKKKEGFEVIFDKGVSGGTDFFERSGGKRILYLLETNSIESITTQEFSRIGRSIGNTLTVLEEFSKRGVNVRIEGLGVDSIINNKPNPSWKIISTTMSLCADLERTLGNERREEGKRVARLNGVKFGRKFGSNETIFKFMSKSKNIEIRKDLEKGYKYQEIIKIVGTSNSTISKVNKHRHIFKEYQKKGVSPNQLDLMVEANKIEKQKNLNLELPKEPEISEEYYNMLADSMEQNSKQWNKTEKENPPKEKEEINYNHEIALILQENQKNLEK